MGRACCVSGCPSGGDVPSHQIPKNPVLFKKWKNLIYSEKLQHLTDEQISKCTVCCRHFSDDDYLITYRVRKLKRGVAPSLHLPNNSTINHEVSKAQEKTQKKLRTASKEENVAETVLVSKVQNEELEISEVALFEDLPEKLESPIPVMLEETFEEVHEIIRQTTNTITNNEQSDMHMEQSVSNLLKKNKPDCKVRTLKKKAVKSLMEQLVLHRRKKRAELYAKTSTIQKLLSRLTPFQRLFIEARIRRSRYSPMVYMKIYHNIARNWALGQ